MLKKIISSMLIGGTLLLSVPMVTDFPDVTTSIAYATRCEQYEIDDSSVWISDDSSMFGAGVTDTNTGYYFTTIYRLDKITSRLTYVMQSKNGAPFVQIGTIDWSRMHSVDIGTPETGGRLFRVVADTAARKKGYQKMF